MILSSIAAVLLVAQQAEDRVHAVYPDDPETWTLEYPSLIGPFVEDYYSCLKGGSYHIGDGRGFAEQYRLDIPRCAKLAQRLERRANERIAERGRGRETPPEAVSAIFDQVRSIHLARGRDLDRTIATRLGSNAGYREARKAGTPSECVARVNGLRAERQAYAEAEGPRIKAIYAQDEYSDEDRRAIFAFERELARRTGAIKLELGVCPAAAYAVNAGPDGNPEG